MTTEADKHFNNINLFCTCIENDVLPSMDTVIDIFKYNEEHKLPSQLLLILEQGKGKSTLAAKVRGYFNEIGWNTFNLPHVKDRLNLLCEIERFIKDHKRGAPLFVVADDLQHQPEYVGEVLRICSQNSVHVLGVTTGWSKTVEAFELSFSWSKK